MLLMVLEWQKRLEFLFSAVTTLFERKAVGLLLTRDCQKPSWFLPCGRTVSVLMKGFFACGKTTLHSPLKLRSAVSSHPAFPAEIEKPRERGFFISGGERGIRTLDTAQHRIHAFQASPFNHSGISPFPVLRRKGGNFR